MIIQNGTIQFKQKTATGINLETGYPIKGSVDSWSTRLPCQYIKNKYNNLGMIKGEHYNIAQYTILIEKEDVPSEQILLQDLMGNEIGKFTIISNEVLEALDEVKILV